MAERHPAGDTVTIEDLLRIEADEATDWDPELSPIERVTSVALGLDSPRTAGSIADRADVPEAAARDDLEFLAGQLGVVESAPTDGGRKYWPNEAYLRFRHVAQLVEKHDKDELTAQIATLKERIECFTEEYGVDDPDELRTRTADGDVSAEQAREFRTAAREWETVEYQLSTIQDALKRYDGYARGYRQEVRLGSSDLESAGR
jgi:predicted ArsR family transcriptional regulator